MPLGVFCKTILIHFFTIYTNNDFCIKKKGATVRLCLSYIRGIRYGRYYLFIAIVPRMLLMPATTTIGSVLIKSVHDNMPPPLHCKIEFVW